MGRASQLALQADGMANATVADDDEALAVEVAVVEGAESRLLTLVLQGAAWAERAVETMPRSARGREAEKSIAK